MSWQKKADGAFIILLPDPRKVFENQQPGRLQ